MATAVTTTIDDEVLAKLDALSGGRSRDAVIAEAVRSYVEEAAFDAFAQAGEDSIDRGEYRTQDDMRAWLKARYPATPDR